MAYIDYGTLGSKTQTPLQAMAENTPPASVPEAIPVTVTPTTITPYQQFFLDLATDAPLAERIATDVVAGKYIDLVEAAPQLVSKLQQLIADAKALKI